MHDTTRRPQGCCCFCGLSLCAAGTVDLADFFLAQTVDDKAPLRIRLPSKRTPGLEYLVEADSNLAFVEWAKAIDNAMTEWDILLAQSNGSK
jgi:hypothetical protein